MTIALCETSIYLGGMLRPFLPQYFRDIECSLRERYFHTAEKAHRRAASQFFSLPIGRTCGGLKSVL